MQLLAKALDAGSQPEERTMIAPASFPEVKELGSTSRRKRNVAQMLQRKRPAVRDCQPQSSTDLRSYRRCPPPWNPPPGYPPPPWNPLPP